MTQQAASWTQIKRELLGLGAEQLVALLHDLYRLNPDNKVFLTSRLTASDDDMLAEPYRKIIQQSFNPPRGLPSFRLAPARKALNDFKKASAKPYAQIDLMLFYVEQAVIGTNTYGDIGEAFYTSLESVFEDALKLIAKPGNADFADTFRPRVRQLLWDARGLGYGSHDTLTELYAELYPPE